MYNFGEICVGLFHQIKQANMMLFSSFAFSQYFIYCDLRLHDGSKKF